MSKNVTSLELEELIWTRILQSPYAVHLAMISELIK